MKKKELASDIVMKKFKRRFSYQLGFLGEGKPGELVTLKNSLSIQANCAYFVPEKLLTFVQGLSGSLHCVQEIRMPSGKRLHIDDGLTCGLIATSDAGARFYEREAIKRGDEIQIDVVIPTNGKIMCALLGVGQEL